MNAEKNLRASFVTGLGISDEEIHEDLAYNTLEAWDSVAHMRLIAEIEDQFDIMMDTDDIIDMNSYSVARDILSKYGVEFE